MPETLVDVLRCRIEAEDEWARLGQADTVPVVVEPVPPPMPLVVIPGVAVAAGTPSSTRG